MDDYDEEYDEPGTGEPEEPCERRCGYVSSGRDLLEHQAYEHVTCSECGAEPHDPLQSVTHKPHCPRLQPGYVYTEH